MQDSGGGAANARAPRAGGARERPARATRAEDGGGEQPVPAGAGGEDQVAV